jgi:hypothetical protein
MKNRNTAAFAAPGIPGMTKLEYAAIQIFSARLLDHPAMAVDAAIALFNALDEEAKKK